MIIKGTGGVGSRRTNEVHPNNNIIANGQNTEKSPGDMRRIAVPQSSVKDTERSPNLGQKTRPYINHPKKKKKKTCKIVDFAVPADHRIKLKEYQKKDKYLEKNCVT